MILDGLCFSKFYSSTCTNPSTGCTPQPSTSFSSTDIAFDNKFSRTLLKILSISINFVLRTLSKLTKLASCCRFPLYTPLTAPGAFPRSRKIEISRRQPYKASRLRGAAGCPKTINLLCILHLFQLYTSLQ